MASKFVRNISDVKDTSKLAEHVTTINDIVSTVDGKTFIRTINGFEEITGGASSSDITTLKSEQTKLKNRVTELETQNADFETRIKALETPTP